MRISRRQAKALGLGGHLPRPRRKPAHVKGRMNATERRYAVVLDGRVLAGEVRGWSFEADTLPLGPEMTFTPDFRIEENDGTLTYVDVKGAHIWEDATVKIKCAAVLYPQHRFERAQWKDGRWKVKRFRSGKETE